MTFNNKYLFGGKLNKEEKIKYFEKLKNLYLVTGKEDKYYSDILKDLLRILYTNIDKDIEEYIEEYKDNKYMAQYEVLKKKYENVKYDASLSSFLNDRILDIPEFNIRSLQIVILFTELVRLTNTFADTTMKKYFQPNIKIYDIYDNIKLVWDDYKKLYNNLLKVDVFKSLFGQVKIDFTKDSGITYKIINNWTFRNIKLSRIICYLDLISPKEMVFSAAHEIYYLGIATQMEWADGLEVTPFEFLHHDITHANNRGSNGYNAELENKFILYLDAQKDIIKLDSKKTKQIYIMLFMIMHESMSEYLLTKKISEDIHFSSLYPAFITDITKWKNIKSHGSLLPKELFETQNDEKIKLYLNDSFNLLKSIWNNFLDIKDIIPKQVEIESKQVKIEPKQYKFLEHIWNAAFGVNI